MKSPANQDDSLLQKLIESARRHGDSKSIFGLLLVLEREIGSDAECSSVPPASSESKNRFNPREPIILRSYIE
jgi:hypothetical protein